MVPPMTEEQWLASSDWRWMIDFAARPGWLGKILAFQTVALSWHPSACIAPFGDPLDGLLNFLTSHHMPERYGEDGMIRRVNTYYPRESFTDVDSAFASAWRDIAGNPFRPTLVDPAWLTPDVLGLARTAYEERILPSCELDLVRLAVLADALEEAGAGDDLIGHLRGPGPHVRGCWVIDGLTGRE